MIITSTATSVVVHQAYGVEGAEPLKKLYADSHFEPRSVTVSVVNGDLGTVAVTGPKVLRSGVSAAITIGNHYGASQHDQMPPWLAKLARAAEAQVKEAYGEVKA